MFARIIGLLVFVVAVGCNGGEPVQCEESASCDLASGGVCHEATTVGNRWCAYPDAACPSGYRYSDTNVGDELGGVCTSDVLAELTLSIAGDGAGTVQSAPAGFSCSEGTCKGSFVIGETVELTAASTRGAFLGWSGSCLGKSSCTLTMDADLQVGAYFGTAGHALWALGVGGTLNDFSTDLEVDSEGNIVAVGQFADTVQLGTSTFTSRGEHDAFIVKINGVTGQVMWARAFGSDAFEYGPVVAIGSLNEIYVGGSTAGAIDFGSGPLPFAGNVDAYVAKLSSVGEYQWTKSFSGPDSETIGAIVTVSNGVVFAGGLAPQASGKSDLIVTALSGEGTVNWSRSFATISSTTNTFVGPSDLAAHEDGSVVVVGAFSGSVEFDGVTYVTENLEQDGFLLKLSNSGVSLLFKRVRSSSVDSVNAVTVDDDGNIYAAGKVSGQVDFGSGGTPATPDDMFLVKYSSAGAYRWAKIFSGPGIDVNNFVAALAADDTGVVMGGVYGESISFGGPSLQPSGGYDAFVVRFNSAGEYVNAVSLGGSSVDELSSLAVAVDGRFFACGSFAGVADFAGKSLTATSPNHYDGFVASFLAF